MIPAPFSLGASLDVFDHEDTHREELTEEPCQPKFPLPARFRRGRQFLLALLPILPWLAARGLAPPARSALSRALFLRFFDTIPGFGLDVQVGMRGSEDAIPLSL